MNTTSDPTPAISSAQQSAGSASLGTQIRASFLSNWAATFGALWSVILLMGGLSFLVYFASIGFMPDIDLQTVVALLAVSALTSGFLLIMLGFYLLAPGWCWVQVTRHQESLKSPGWFGLPMLGVIASIFLIPKWWCVVPLLIISSVVPPLLLLSSGKLLDTIFFFCRKLLDKLGSRKKLGTVGVFYLGFLPSVLLFVPLFLLVSGLIGANQDLRKDAMSVALSAVLGIWMCNIALVRLVADGLFSISLYLILAIATIFLLFAQLNTWTLIPKLMMSIYRFGNLKDASLVLNETGCAIAQHHGLMVTPNTSDPKTDTTPGPKTCALSNVIIHSRLGNTYYLEVSRSGDTSLHFTIPGQNVLSWAVNESKKATPAGAPTNTQNSAPSIDTTLPNQGMKPMH